MADPEIPIAAPTTGAGSPLGALRGLFRRGRRAIVATTWTLLGYGAGRILRLVARLVLARLLVEKDFGQFWFIAAILVGVEMLSDVGIGVSVVQNKDGDQEGFVDTAFTLQAGRGAVLGLLCLAAAYPVGLVYGARTGWLLCAASLSPILSGLASISIFTLTRRVDLRKVALLGTASDGIGAGTAIVWALFDPSPWALLMGHLATTLVLTGGSHFLLPTRSRFAWSRDHARSMIRFGLGLLLSSASFFLSRQAERLLLPKLIGWTTFGIMGMAFMFTDTLNGATGQFMSRIILPIFSEAVRESKQEAARRFGQARNISMLAVIPVGLVFVLGGEFLINTLLPEGYAVAGPILEILAISTILGLDAGPRNNLLVSVGLSRYLAMANMLRFVVVLPGVIYSALNYDILTVSWVLVLSSVPSLLVGIYGLKKHFGRAVLMTDLRATALVVAFTGACRWLT